MGEERLPIAEGSPLEELILAETSYPLLEAFVPEVILGDKITTELVELELFSALLIASSTKEDTSEESDYWGMHGRWRST